MTLKPELTLIDCRCNRFNRVSHA